MPHRPDAMTPQYAAAASQLLVEAKAKDTSQQEKITGLEREAMSSEVETTSLKKEVIGLNQKITDLEGKVTRVEQDRDRKEGQIRECSKRADHYKASWVEREQDFQMAVEALARAGGDAAREQFLHELRMAKEGRARESSRLG